MKKIIVLILAVAMLIPLFAWGTLNAEAEMPSTTALDGYENLCLTYTFRYGSYKNGAHTADDLMPYVAYLDNNGKAKDYFFDSYLFLPCVTYGPSGARIHADSADPTLAIDWTTYVEDTFMSGHNVDALETAMGRANSALGGNKKAGVYFSILYPCKTATNFGTLGGKSLNFSKQEDRKYAIKWIIDEQLKLYKNAGYKNLDLVGFYWLEEYLYNDGSPQLEVELFKYASEYLHSLGLKFIWIPWYTANGFNIWKNLGFDVACMQPNMFWQDIGSINRVDTSIRISKQNGMCMEMEVDGRALTDSEYYNRYLDYLESGMKNGAMKSIKMYYQDGKPAVYYQACNSTNSRARSVYDLTYKYAKKTLTQADIDFCRSDKFALPKGIKWVSKGKPYTSNPSFVDGNGMDYQNVNGKELTDGIIATEELSTDWHAFHISNRDDEGRMSAIVDLGKVRNDLTCFMAHFDNCRNYGIGYPSDIKFYVSNDGKNFTLLTALDLEISDNISYVKYRCVPTTARYVKLSFLPQSGSFVFLSEILVGIDSDEEEPPQGNTSNDKEDTSSSPVSKPEDENPTSSEAVTEPEDESNAVESSVTDSTTVASTENDDLSSNDEIENESETEGTSNADENSGSSALIWIFVALGMVIIVVVAIVLIKHKK